AATLRHRRVAPEVVAAARAEGVDQAAGVDVARLGLVREPRAVDQHGADVLEVERAWSHLDALLLARRPAAGQADTGEVQGGHPMPARGEVRGVATGAGSDVQQRPWF